MSEGANQRSHYFMTNQTHTSSSQLTLSVPFVMSQRGGFQREASQWKHRVSEGLFSLLAGQRHLLLVAETLMEGIWSNVTFNQQQDRRTNYQSA